MISKIQTSLLTSLAAPGIPPYNSTEFWTPKQLELSGLMDKTEVTIQQFLKVEPYPEPILPIPSNLSFQERYILQYPASITTGKKQEFFKYYYSPLIKAGTIELAWQFVDLYESENTADYPDHAHTVYSTGISEARDFFLKNAIVDSISFEKYWVFFNTYLTFDLSNNLNFFINSKSKQDPVYNASAKYEIAEIVLPLYEANGGGTDLRTILNDAKAGTVSSADRKLYSDYLSDNGNWAQTSNSYVKILIYQIASERLVLSSNGNNYVYVDRAVKAIEFEANYLLKIQYLEALNQYVKSLFI